MLVLDAQDFAFRADLGRGLRHAGAQAGALDGFVAPPAEGFAGTRLGGVGTLRLREAALDEAAFGADGAPATSFAATHRPDEPLAVALDLGAATRLDLVRGLDAGTLGGGTAAALIGRSVLDLAALGPAPVHGQGFRVAHDLAPGQTVEAALARGDDDGYDDDATDLALGGLHGFGPLRLGWGVGVRRETGAASGLAGSGAFGGDADATTPYARLLAALDATDRLSLFGGYGVGRTGGGGGGGYLADVDAVTADSFLLGLRLDDLAGDDGLSLTAALPLAARNAGATLRVPVAENRDGTVRYEERRVRLDPDAREVAFQLAYERALPRRRLGVAAGAFARLNPDNDGEAAPDLGVGVRLTKGF